MTKQDTTLIESPTVRQIRIAFEQTPSKLRAAEQGWRERRKEISKRIQPVQGSHTTEKEKKRTEGEVGHIAKYPAVSRIIPEIVVSAKPITGPPTPERGPPTPERTPPTCRNDVQSKHSDSNYPPAPDTPAPILAYPLAPRLASIQMGRCGSLSISHPSSPHEVTIRIGKQRISVLRGGHTLEIGTKGEKRTIHREDHRSWSSTVRKQWEMVRDFVEQVKRQTPRIKIYHPSALITVTCSSPPDIIIAFTMSQDPPNSKRIYSKAKSTATVKLVYSPLRNKMTIDTDDKHGGKGETTLRTRRCIPLPPSHLNKLVARRATSSAAAALELNMAPDYLTAELEAVERFWSLREEWLR